MSRIWHSYWLSLTAIVCDRGVLLLVLIGPVVYSIYYPYPYSPEVVHDVPVAVVDLDQSSLSRRLVRFADASPDVDVVSVGHDVLQARQALWNGDIDGAMIIPRGFRRDVLRGEATRPIVLGNGAYFMFNRAELLGLAGATLALSGEVERKHLLTTSVSTRESIERSQPVRVDYRATSNPMGGYATYAVPAIAVVVLQQTLLIGICMLLGTWRENGAPFSLQYFGNRMGLALAAATICAVNALYYVGLVYWREDYPHLGQFHNLLPVIVLLSLTVGAWAVAAGSIFRFREQAVVYLLPTSIPVIFLAGFAWPFESIPVALRWFGSLIPSTPGIQGFLKVDQMGAELLQVAPELLKLALLFGAAVVLIFIKNDWPVRSEG